MEIQSINSLSALLKNNLDGEKLQWLHGKLEDVIGSGTPRQLYMLYSLSGNKIKPCKVSDFKGLTDDLEEFLAFHKADLLEMTRIHILQEVLNNGDQWVPAVKKLIEIADKTELETFLKYLSLLPDSGNYKFAAVEALRTNIVTVFDAISQHNPYPAEHFNEQQWNQMFLKAAFLDRDLGGIADIDKRANANLARIISDYAHERWAASRKVAPKIWRPVSNFLDDVLLNDIKKLFESEDPKENQAAFLVCNASSDPRAKALMEEFNSTGFSTDKDWDSL